MKKENKDLTQKDIESLGFKCIRSGDDLTFKSIEYIYPRENNSKTYYIVHNPKSKWTNIYCIEKIGNKYGDDMFTGAIKDKPILEKLLKKLKIPK